MNTRLLPLQGESGILCTRVYTSYQTIPYLSTNNRLECATRSILRLKNLVAVRGIPGAGMIGPCDYYGNLEKPDENLFTFGIEDKTCLLDAGDKNCPIKITSLEACRIDELSDFVDIELHIIRVYTTWISGKNVSEVAKGYANAFGGTLFDNPGILEVYSNCPKLSLSPICISSGILTGFKARIVEDQVPFQITTDKLNESDEYRAVSFQYESGYASRQISHGGGLFLEVHDFAQTITPLDEETNGFVTLGRWDKRRFRLELIAVKIPFGSTLIIEKGCIHGDTTLVGMYMMCMTSNHLTMKTADTVFLKHFESKENIILTINEDTIEPRNGIVATRPLVLFDDHTPELMESYRRSTLGWSIIFNPLSKAYWRTI